MTPTPQPERIVLVGFMGAGKTTVGRELARMLRWEFLDLDDRIEKEAGQSISALFAKEGETAFREREFKAARATEPLRKHVIAAGGGAFAQRNTRASLRSQAVTIWLRCNLDRILKRTAADRNRPLASDHETMRQLLHQREPSYALADWVLDVDDREPRWLAERIVTMVGLERSAKSER